MNAKDIYQTIMDSYDVKEKCYKLIIWVGAGIDHDAPTSLPLGNTLTEFMIVNSMPDHLLKRYYCHCESKKKKMLAKTYGQLRLETVIEAYRIFENSILDNRSPHPFLNGFRSFENRPPNDIHIALARLLKDGANIVTANYDNCINNAYYNLTNDQLKCIRDNSSTFHKGYYTYSSSLAKTGTIYHFHGVAHDIESLGASLTQLCNGLSLSFQIQIENWIKNGYTFLFLGYSGGDALDVNPFFQRLKDDIGNTAIFLRYDTQHERRVPLEFMNQYERILLKPFACKIVFESTITKILNIKKEGNIKSVEKSWEDSFFEKGEKLNSDMRLIVTMVLCCLLGLTDKKLLPTKWWIKVKECKEVDPWLINFYGHQLANNLNNPIADSYFSPYDHNSPLEISDKLAEKNDIKKAVLAFGDINKIYYKLQVAVESETLNIDWNISTPLNRMTDYLIVNYKIDQKDIDNLLKSLYTIIKNRHKIVDILQYTTALRAYGILLVQYKRNVEGINYIKESLDLYKEINSQKGIIKTLFFLKKCYMTYPEDLSHFDLLKKRFEIDIQIITMIITYRQFRYLKKVIYRLYKMNNFK